MTHGAKVSRTISAEGIPRVEGEGSLRVQVRDGRVTDVALDIFEPPRYFEALLVGRHFSEAPDITARICGICPVAYQMSACAAMEDACGVDRRRADQRRFVASSTAASGSRATRCTSTCCTRRTSSAAPTRSNWPNATPARSSAGSTSSARATW